MTEEAPARDRPWLVRLARMLADGAADRARDRASEPEPDLLRQVEELILGGPRRYSGAQLREMSGLDRDAVARLWRSLGFAEVDEDAVVFTDGDREALARLRRLHEAGLLPDGLEDAVARSFSTAMAGLAEWQVEMVYQLVGYGHSRLSGEQVLEITRQVLPLLRDTQNFVWRRHLAAAAARLLPAPAEDSGTRSLVVGFVDMVGFTRATRTLSPGELTLLIEDFQAMVGEVVASGNGRVIKTVGDEVLFVTDEPGDGAQIALTLADRVARSAALPELRIGLAVGSVVTRFGDVYGEPVNIAARLTTHAQPGRILADRNLAGALEHDERFRVRPRRPLAVRGYRHLQSWGLTWAKPNRTRVRRRSVPVPSTDDPAPA